MCVGMVLLTAACAGSVAVEPLGSADPAAAPERAATLDPALVAAVGAPPQRSAYLDPDAEPRTELGKLRARVLPVWADDFDWAFPPRVCHSPWELDAVAAPVGNPGMSRIEALGDLHTAIALSVMRFEYQTAKAFADPSPLGQLCIAVASVGQARDESLASLRSYLADSLHRAVPAQLPHDVTLVGLSPNGQALALSCSAPPAAATVDSNGDVAVSAADGARLTAYLLELSEGVEDEIVDLSYRVSGVAGETAPGCDASDARSAWEARWRATLDGWTAEGQLWVPMSPTQTFSPQSICAAAGSVSPPTECPADWLR